VKLDRRFRCQPQFDPTHVFAASALLRGDGRDPDTAGAEGGDYDLWYRIADVVADNLLPVRSY